LPRAIDQYYSRVRERFAHRLCRMPWPKIRR
jgi:hypothetical protein